MSVSPPISPLAPVANPVLPPMQGVRMAAVEAGIKYKNRKDLMVIVFDSPTNVAGIFTKSRCPSAPVDWCRHILASGNCRVRAVVVNSGNANAFTGKAGVKTVEATANALAEVLECEPQEILLASTGVIGEPLDADQFTSLFPEIIHSAKETEWLGVAEAIMTTDTYPKLATQNVMLDNTAATLNGIAKGSGMIAPDMATMLSFLVTDCPIAPALLQDMLSELATTSFNAITVDSDTSTSDTVLLFATGTADCPILEATDDSRYPIFRDALEALMVDLARQIVCDGEGAKKLIKVEVSGAVGQDMARRVAFSVADSPLVKTAMAGEDANWGRIIMAVGKSGEAVDRDKIKIYFDNVRVTIDGARDPQYDEQDVIAIMAKSEINIRIDLGLGEEKAHVWTCDLTKDYVAINGDYRS